MPLRFTLRQLEYFVAAADCGSIAAASQKLNVSSPSISTAISQLERELGMPLFVRQRAQGLKMTEAGRTLAAQALRVLDEATEMTRLAGAVSSTVQGPLRLGCLVSFAQIVVSGLRRSFEDEYPAVRTSQVEMTQAEIFAALRRAEIDMALTYDLNLPPDLEFHGVKNLPPYVFLAPEHPLADRESLTVHDLATYPMVLLDLPISSEYFQSFFTREGLRPVISERTRDMAVMRSLVANGYGYSIANFRPLNDVSPDGKPLKFVPLVGELRYLAMGVLTVPGATSSSTNAAFVEHCRAKLNE
ncbi:HTH-type transcriptional regulator CynR [Falsiruegeria litorea R37]|uniref:HTH-type transcriptional regulator CynR n=1 Tax=Falsiruegeria litorea R37 TaxID=1200284 RepID=A0A1Y5TVF9_9RHOB|nr:LysR family transcriptional regulator [Falsiruegeria litorea]SLN72970.1 HTH-type transcriptional regulator CynR [Falsiruegeria litorea R37]